MWLLKGSESAGDNPNGAAGQGAIRVNEDMKEQFEQQQVLLQQLKDLVRKNEQQLMKKEQDLEESAAKLSKLKLQHKAKIVQLNNKLQEAQKKTIGQVAEKKPEHEQASETLSVDSSRGKVLMLKKQLEESKAIFEKRQKEMADKKNTVEEVLASLKIQLDEKDKVIAQLQSENMDNEMPPTLTTKQDDTGIQEMYAQIVYKDSKILDLDSRILQLERQVMDLQENVKEKEEVIQTRNKAIQLMTEDLSRRGKVVVDQLDDTRDQMRLMQENFAALEADWKTKEARLVVELDEVKMTFGRELSEKKHEISDLKMSLSKLENVRFELISRNAQLQEKVVRLQESLEKASTSSVEESTSCLQPEMDLLKEELKKKNLIISDLQLAVGGTSKSSNQKLIKLKAQHKSQVRALELQIKELRSCNDNSDQVMALQNRIADLEEEKGNLQLRLVDCDEYFITCGQQQGQILELKEKVAQQSTDLDEHIKMISMIQGKHLDMIEQLAEKNRYIEDLELAQNEAKAHLQNEREIKINLEMEVNSMKTSNEAQQGSCEELLSKLKTMTFEYEELHKALSDMEKAKSSLDSANEELRGAVSELRHNLTLALTENDGLTKGIQSKSRLLEKLQEELLEASHELQQEIEYLKMEKENSNLLIQKKDAFILQQTEEIGELSSMTARLANELHSKTEESNLLSERIAQLTLELNTNMDTHSMEEKKAKDKFVSLIEQLGETEAEVNRLQALCTEHDAKFQNAVMARENALGELHRSNEMIIEIQMKLSNVEDQNSALVKLQDDHQNTIQENVIRIEDLNRQLQQQEDYLNDHLIDTTSLNDNLKQTTIQLREEITLKENIEKQLGHLRTCMESKQEELKNLQRLLHDKDAQCLKFQMELQNALDISVEHQKRISELTDKCTTLEEVAILSNQNQITLEQTTVKLQTELENTTEKWTALVVEMAGLKDNLNAATSALADETVTKQDIERQLETAEMQHKNLMEEKQEEIKHLMLKLENLQSEGGTHEAWGKTLEIDLTKFKSELHKSNQLTDELKIQISSYKDETEHLLLENTTLQDECKRMITECANKGSALETITQELQIAKTDLENVSSYLQTVNSELESRSSTIDFLQMELKDIKNILNSTTSEKAALETDNANLNEQLVAMDHKLAELSPKLEKFNSLIIEYTLLQEKFENCSKNHDIEASQLKLELNNLHRNVQHKELELSEKSQALQEVLEVQQNETANLSVLEKALQNARGQIDVIVKERDSLQDSVERLYFFETEFHKQVDSIGMLESEAKQLSEEGSRLRDQSARLMEYIQQLEADLAATSEAAKEIESEENFIFAGFTECLEKLQRVVHKFNAPEVEIRKLDIDISVQEIKTEGSNLNSVLKEFNMLQKNACSAFEGLNKRITSANENGEKLLLELSIVQENYTLAISEKQELEQRLLEFISLKQQVQILMEQNSEVEQKLAAANITNQTLKEALFKQNDERLSIKEDNLKLKQEIERSQTKIYEQEKQIECIQSDFSNSQQQSESFQVQIQQLTELVQSLKSDASEQVRSLSGQLELANKEVQMLQSEIQRLQNELLQQDLSIGELNSSLEDFKTKYNDSQIQNKEHEMRIQQFIEHAYISDKEVQSRHVEMEALIEQLDHLKSKLTDTEIGLKANADLLRVQASEIQQLLQCIDEKDKQLETTATSAQEHEALQVQIEDLGDLLKIANEKIANFEVLVSNVNQKILHEKENNEKLKLELEKMHKETQLNENIQRVEKEWQLQKSDYEMKIQKLQNQILISSSHLEEAESIICRLQDDTQEKNKLCNDFHLNLEQKIASIDLANEKLTIFTTIISQLESILFSNVNVEVEHNVILEEHGVQPLNDLHASGISTMTFEDSCAILSKVQETIQEYNEKMSVRESDLSLLQESLQSSTTKISNLESSNERLREEVDQLKEQHLFLQTQLSQSFETDATVDMLKSQLENSTKEKQVMQDSFKEQENVIGALLDQRRHLEERLTEAQENLTRDAMEIERMIIENSHLEEKLVVEHNAQIVSHQQISDFNDQLQSINDLKSKVEELEDFNRILSEEKNLLEHKLNSMDIEIDEKKSSLQMEIEKLKQEVSILQEDKLRYDEQLQTSVEEIKQLNEEKRKYECLANGSVAERHLFEDLKSEHEQLKLCNKELNDKLLVWQSMEFQSKDKESKEDMANGEKLMVALPSVATDHLLGASPSEQPSIFTNRQAFPETSPEHKQLKTQLAVLQIKNEKMLSKLKLFKDKNDKLQLQINNLLTTQGLLEDDKVRLSHYNEHAKDEIGHLSSELRNVERLWKSEVNMLQDRLDTVEVAHSIIVEIKEDIESKLVMQIDHGKVIMDEKMALEQSLSDALAKLQLQESVHKENVDQLTLKQAQLERQLDSLQKHETFLESDNTEFQNLIEKLRFEKAKSDQEIKAQSEKYVLLVQEHNKMKTEFEDLSLQLEDFGDVFNLKKTYTTLQKDYKELVNVKLHLESEAEYLKNELKAAVSNKASLEMEVHSAKSMLLAAPRECETIDNVKIEKQDAEHSDLCQAIQQLTKELADVKFENDEFKNKAHLSQLNNLQNQTALNNVSQIDDFISTLKFQNAELLKKISCLEGDIWKLEEEKQQIVDLRHFDEQKLLSKALADMGKLQEENKRLIEELDNQDVDLKHLETEKDQIEAEARLTFQQQQEMIKGLRTQLQQREEQPVYQDNKIKDSADVQKLNIELSFIKEKLSEKVLQLESEAEKSSCIEAKNNELRNDIEHLRIDLRHCQDEKHSMNIELANLKSDFISMKQQLDHWKMQYSAIVETQVVSTEALQRQSLNLNIGQNSESSYGQELQLFQTQVEKLSAELQHTMHSLHAKDLRCEQLTSEIMQLIEERDSLQLRLSSLLRADQQKEMKVKLLEKQLMTHPIKPSALTDIESINNSSEDQRSPLVYSESLDRKLRESEEQRKELQQINAVLDQALAAEREHRIKITADLKFANEELAGLGRRPKLKRETTLIVDEDDDGQVPLLPERSQTLERSYMRTSWRITNWIQGRSTPRILHV